MMEKSGVQQRTDGALVRIITPVYGNEEVKDAEARIQEFTWDGKAAERIWGGQAA